MQFSIQREALLKPLQQVVGVVERRQTLPVLANLLVKVADGRLSFTGTDLEVEMVATTEAEKLDDGEITIPARKLFDIVKALPDGAKIELKLNGDRVSLNAGRSRFTLTTLPASEFPTVDEIELVEKVSLPEEVLRDLMERTSFAMANQDVRYYLNGMLLDLQEHTLRCVATDGHRLAMKETQLQSSVTTRRQIIIPRKGVNELVGLLEAGDGEVELEFGRNHLRVRRGDVVFTSKLIDGRFPDYEAVIPLGADKAATLDREVLRGALQRAAILSNCASWRITRSKKKRWRRLKQTRTFPILPSASTWVICSMRWRRCAATRLGLACAMRNRAVWCRNTITSIPATSSCRFASDRRLMRKRLLGRSLERRNLYRGFRRSRVSGRNA
jgi:DNA polymerase-3 subunit beta